MRIRPLVWFILGGTLLSLALAGCTRETAPIADGVSDQPTEQVADIPTTEPSTQLIDTTQSNDDGAVAIVNGVPISGDQFARTKEQVLSQYQQIYSQFDQDVRTLLGGAQGRLFDLRIEDETLEQATTRAVVLGELAQRSASVSEGDVDAEFQKQFDEFLTIFGMAEGEFKTAFESGTLSGYQTGDLTYQQFIDYAKQSVREEFEIQALQTLLAGTIEHSQEELIAFFDEHRSEYDIAEQVRASHILVADEALAQQLLDELDAGADFSTLAQEYSTDTGSGSRGGDLGWFERGRMVAAFDEAAFTTLVRERSGIVPTQYGYHIIWVTDYQPAVNPSYEEVAERVTTDFEANVKSQLFTEWYAAARPVAEIIITDPMLDAYRKQQEDADVGLQAFIALRDAGTVDDLYLNYIIGTIFETKMDEATSKKRGIEGNETLTPSQQAQIDALEAEIEGYRSQAVASYEAALAALGTDSEIKARIDMLSPLDIEETDSVDETSSK